MKTINILFIEDTFGDVELIKNELRKAHVLFDSRWVDSKEEFMFELDDFSPDVIICDYSLPCFTGMELLLMFKETKKNIPFIIVTGNLSEQLALDFIEAGVDDFIVKSSFGRVPNAIKKAIEKKEIEKEKEFIAAELMQSQIQLRALLKNNQVVREEERSSIALEIHDELGQQLTALKMDIDWIMYHQKDPESNMVNKLKEMIKLNNDIINSVRRISFSLRPAIIDDLGLLAALEWKCADFEEKTGIVCHFNSTVKERKFDKNFSISAFRILQESLHNVTKHAAAKSVSVSLEETDKELLMEISDDGIGITNDKINNNKTLGIFGMKERAMMLGGKLVAKGIQNKGTKIELALPFEAELNNK